MCHYLSFVLIFISYFSKYSKEWWQFHFLRFISSLDPQDGRIIRNVQESFDHEVLSLEDEALPQLLNRVPRGVRVLTQLDVVSCTDLALLLDFLTFNLISHLLTVSEGVVLANLSQNVSLADCSCDECLFKLESLNFDAVRNVELGVRLLGYEQVLPRQTGWEWHSYEREHLLEYVVYFHLEAFLSVLHDVELRVSNPSLLQSPVNFPRLLY